MCPTNRQGMSTLALAGGQDQKTLLSSQLGMSTANRKPGAFHLFPQVRTLKVNMCNVCVCVHAHIKCPLQTVTSDPKAKIPSNAPDSLSIHPALPLQSWGDVNLPL